MIHEKNGSLDHDVAVQLERVRRGRNARLKDVVNEALRRGLRDMSNGLKKASGFRTRAFHMGKPLIDLDNTAEVLAYIEGEDS